jgi:hypothetical protein
MSKFEEYQGKYKHVTMERRDGILQMTLHSEGGPLKWGGPPHEELSYAFYDVARDHGNRCVIITGTGDAFCAEVDLGGGRGAPVGKTASGESAPPPRAGVRATTWDHIYNDAKYLLMNHLNIEVAQRSRTRRTFPTGLCPAMACTWYGRWCWAPIAADTSCSRGRSSRRARHWSWAWSARSCRASGWWRARGSWRS